MDVNNRMNVIPVKSTLKLAKKRTGGKIFVKPQPMSVEVALTKGKGPNMSRKSHRDQLHSFPVFDKCDSMIFFPAKFTSYLNSGDFNSLRRLMKTRFEKDCTVNLCGSCTVNVDQFIQVFECMNELHPDGMYCADRTSIIGNELRSTMHYKYTESTAVREGMKRNFPHNKMVDFCVPPSRNPVKIVPFLEAQPRKLKRVLAKIIYEAEELVVYGKTYMTLVFDELTKTVVHFDFANEFTTFRLPMAQEL